MYDKYVYLKNIDIDETGIKLLSKKDFYFPDNHYDYLLCFTRDFGVQQLVSQYYYLFKKKDFPEVRKTGSFKKDIWSIPRSGSTSNPEIALLGAYFSPNVFNEINRKTNGRAGNIPLPIVPGLTGEVDADKRKALADFSTDDTV